MSYGKGLVNNKITIYMNIKNPIAIEDQKKKHEY